MLRAEDMPQGYQHILAQRHLTSMLLSFDNLLGQIYILQLVTRGFHYRVISMLKNLTLYSTSLNQEPVKALR